MIFAIVGFLVVVAGYLFFKAFTASDDNSNKKVSLYGKFEAKDKRRSGPSLGISGVANLLGNFNTAWVKLVPKIEEFYKKTLLAANSKLTVGGLLFIKEITLIVGFVICTQIFSLSVRYAFIGIVVFFFVPDIIMKSKVSKRQYQILRTFPEIVDLLGLCLSAGLDFTAALKWLTEGRFLFSNPFIEELKSLKDEIVLGKSKSQALKDMDKRLGIPEVSSLVRTLVIAENMGVSVAEALDRFSIDARERRFHRGERQARVASIKILFPLIFLILPVVGIIIIGPIVLKFSQEGFSMGL